jgi:flagellar biosynthetic protein FliR
MPVSVHFGIEAVSGFVLTLTRVSGALILLPLPGMQYTPQTARIVLIAGITFALFPTWPVVPAGTSDAAFLMALLMEASAGLLMGLALLFLAETFQLGAQVISFQTGFSFASTFDPTSQADSGVFQVFAQLAAGLLFFVLGIHRHLIRMLASSADVFAAHNGQFEAGSISLLVHLGTNMFISGVTLALPVAALLFLVDQGLSVLGRLQSQLQLLTLAFPAKIIISLLFLGAALTRWPGLYANWAKQILDELFRLIAP